MVKNPFLFNKTLVIGIIITFIGTSVISSTGNIIDDAPSDYSLLEYVENPKGLFTCDHIAYICSPNFYDCWIYEMPLNTTEYKCICFEPGASLISGGTCTIDERIMTVEYNTGQLWEIDPKNCEITLIGGGGVGLNGITYDPVTYRLYGTSSSDLYEIDPDTGEQTCIGSHCQPGKTIISIACDRYGSLYGWDVLFTGESHLYEIDTETGEATIVGGMGMSLLYAQDGDFCKIDDILYLAAYTGTGQSYLCICDKETGELTILGQFEGGAEITLFAIPWNFRPEAPIIYEEYGLLYIYSVDPDNNNVKYFIDWGDGTTLETGWHTSGQIVNINHEWPEGSYDIIAKAKDIYGAESDWSDPYTIVIEKNPPNAPTINGPNRGKPGVEYTFTFNAVDQDGDDIANYTIFWGEGPYEILEGPFASGSSVKANYSFTSQNNYTIMAKAKDKWGAESVWSEFEVEIPRIRPTYQNFFQWFLERLPTIERLLSLVRDLDQFFY